MEIEQVKQPESTPKKSAKPTTSKMIVRKFDPETYKVLTTLKEKANKKQFGRKVKEMEIIKTALSLVQDEHLKTLQDATLSEQDKLMLAHAEYVKAHGKITLDQFIGRLIRGEIAPLKSNLA